VTATVTFAEYVKEERETGEGKRKPVVWRSVPQLARSVNLLEKVKLPQ